MVGRWVRGREHYNRHSLIKYLLTAQDNAFWVVGTRRMGKTSLLRQLELIASRYYANFVPLFWDLQGCTTPEALSKELYLALEDVAERFAEIDIDIESLQNEDAAYILRRLNRALVRQDRQLLLLVDEAEVLIDIIQMDSAWLARLRKALQEGHHRTIIVSTKLLSQLTDQSADWHTSPFLFGFHMVNLWPLRREGAIELVLQTQADVRIEVDAGVMEKILRYTNHHPYLIQFLCQRLLQANDTSVEISDGGVGSISGERHDPEWAAERPAEAMDRPEVIRLRDVEERDLRIDHQLMGFFHIDYQRLTDMEQRILIAVAEAGSLTEEALASIVGSSRRARLPGVLNSLRELGHLRQTEDRIATGSEFLRRWLQQNLTTLKAELGLLGDEELRHRLGEEDFEAVARSLGVSTERLKALTDVRVSTKEEFFNVIRNFFVEIRHLVEQDDGHKLLITTGPNGRTTLRSEEDVQVALKHWLRPMCRALNIHMDREPLTGRGFLDFKFSIGHDFRCLVEVKLFNNSKLKDGVGIQLPLYLLADKATYGIYIPIFLQPAGYALAVQKLRRVAAERARSHNVEIEVIDIRVWKPKSASKADAIEASERYRIESTPGHYSSRGRTDASAEVAADTSVDTAVRKSVDKGVGTATAPNGSTHDANTNNANTNIDAETMPHPTSHDRNSPAGEFGPGSNAGTESSERVDQEEE